MVLKWQMCSTVTLSGRKTLIFAVVFFPVTFHFPLFLFAFVICLLETDNNFSLCVLVCIYVFMCFSVHRQSKLLPLFQDAAIPMKQDQEQVLCSLVCV